MATIANPNFNKPEDEQKEKIEKPQIPTLTTAQSAATPASQGVQSKTPSSGRFTNIQSYLSANKGAGTKIADTLSSGVSKDIAGKQKDTDREVADFQSAVNKAQNVAQQGQQYLGQITPQEQQAQQQGTPVNPITFDPNTIVSDPNQLNQFTNIRTGASGTQAQQSITKESEEAVNAAKTLANTYGQRTAQLQDPSNRFSLLKEFMATPRTSYTQGLSSLDNAFLQRDTSKSLDKLKQNIGTQQKTVGANLTQNLGNLANTAQTAVQNIQDVGKQLGQQSSANEQAYIDFLNSPEFLEQANVDRKARQDWAQQQLADMKAGKPVSQEFLDMMGLNPNQRTYGYFRNIDDISQIANISPEEVINASQISTPEQRAMYDALARMAGVTSDAYRLKEGTVSAPVSARQDLDFAKEIENSRNMLLTQLGYDPVTGQMSNINPIYGPNSQEFSNIVRVLANSDYLEDQSALNRLVDTMSNMNIQNDQQWNDFFSDPTRAKDYDFWKKQLENRDFMMGGQVGPGIQTRTINYMNYLLNQLNNLGFYDTLSTSNKQVGVNPPLNLGQQRG